MLQKIRKDISLEYPGFRVLCPTRWTVRAESMKSILDNWVALQQVWDESLDENLEPEIKSRIIGIKSQMITFDYFYGVTILQLVLRHSDNLSKTLQKFSLTSCLVKEIADLALQTINSLRSESELQLLWKKNSTTIRGIRNNSIISSRKRKRLLKFLIRMKPLYTMRFLI